MDAETDAAWTASMVGALGLELWAEDGITHGRAEIRPAMWAPGTDIPRLAVFATMIDIVAGCPPDGMVNPTVDLRVSLLARPPAIGTVWLACRPVKVGRRLFVGETVLHAGDPHRPFARSTCTFMNHRVGDSATIFGPRPAPSPGTSFDEMLRARRIGPGVLELDAHAAVSHGPTGNIQGGAQALVAELAAGDLLSPRAMTAIDLDILYLNRVRAATVTATAELPGGAVDDDDRLDGAAADVRVEIRDADDDGRVVSLVGLVCRELPARRV